MERLTTRDIDGTPILLHDKGYAALLDRIAAYEDTGLEPEAIEGMRRSFLGEISADIANEQGSVDISRAKEIANAEADGRLLVLPCKVGDTVWVVGEGRIVGCYIDEACLDNDNNVAYLVSFDCDHDSCISSADFGKTVFLTRDEAEKTLEGKNNA